MVSDYNNLSPKSVGYEKIVEVRYKLLEEVVGKVGEGTFIEPPFTVDYGCNVSIGKNCFANFK